MQADNHTIDAIARAAYSFGRAKERALTYRAYRTKSSINMARHWGAEARAEWQRLQELRSNITH
jgi:hypothetical protein